MNTTKLKKIAMNAIGAATYIIFPIAGHPEINYALDDVSEMVVTGVGLVGFGVGDLAKGHSLAKEFFYGIGGGGFGLLGFDTSANLFATLLSSTSELQKAKR